MEKRGKNHDTPSQSLLDALSSCNVSLSDCILMPAASFRHSNNTGYKLSYRPVDFLCSDMKVLVLEPAGLDGMEGISARRRAPSWMDRLPDEILLIIFEYLSMRDLISISNVCQRWQRLASIRALVLRRPYDAQQVRKSLRFLFVLSPRTNVSMVLTNTRFLHTLIMHDRVPVDDAMLSELQLLVCLRHLDIFPTKAGWVNKLLLPILVRLRTFVVNVMNIEPKMLAAMSNSGITQLHMYGDSQYYKVRPMSLFISARRLHLTELTLRCNELPDNVYEIITSCPNLVVLRLYSCWLLRARSVRVRNIQKLYNLQNGLNVQELICPPNLRVLHITGARMFRKEVLSSFLATLPNKLEELVLSGTAFGEEHVGTLWRRVPNLRVIELWNTPISPHETIALVMKLYRLQELDVDKTFSEDQLKELSIHPSLKRLRCVRPSQMTEAKFREAAGCLSFTAPDARYGRGTLRPDGDGWRAALFYHWSAGHRLLPLPRNCPPPAFDSQFEEDFSLLGPEQ